MSLKSYHGFKTLQMPVDVQVNLGGTLHPSVSAEAAAQMQPLLKPTMVQLLGLKLHWNLLASLLKYVDLFWNMR